MAVAGFRSPGFHRLDKHTELMKQLESEKIVNLHDIINIRNNDGRTALHISVTDNIRCELVELLMSVSSIDLKIKDVDRMTPLDLLKQKPRSASSEILFKRLISAGGISNHHDYKPRNNTIFTHMKTHGIGGSPGTSFRILDAEIFLYTSTENANDGNYNQPSMESSSSSSEVSNANSANSLCNNSKSNSVNHAARCLKFLLQWPRRREAKAAPSDFEDEDSLDPFSSSRNSEEFPIPLRQRYSQSCSLPHNKRTQSIRTSCPPSPSSKMKFTTGLMQGVIQVHPHSHVSLPPHHSIPSPFHELSVASLSFVHKQKGVDIMGPSCSNLSIDDGTLQFNYKQHGSLQ